MQPGNLTHLLRSRRFLPLFITQFFGAFNDNAFKNAFLIWFTYDAALQNGLDAPTVVTLAAGLFILPFFLFSATAGQVVDKYEKSWLTRRIKMAEIILMLACGIGFYLQSVNFLLLVLFLMGVQSTFFGPIKYSLLPEHLKDEELIAGNALIEGGTFLSILLGTIFGGLVINTEHGVAFISVAVVVFAVVGWLSSRHIPTAPVGEAGLKIGWNIARETWRIIGFAREERTVWLSIIGISWFWLVGATFLTQFPVYTETVLYGNEHIVTLLLTMFSVGIGIGALGCNALLRGEINGRLVPFGCAGISLAIGCFVAASRWYASAVAVPEDYLGLAAFWAMGSPAWAVLVSLLFLSIVAGIYIVPLYAIMQHRADSKHLARVIAANNVLNALFMVVGSVAVLVLYGLKLDVVNVLLAVGIANIPVYFVVRMIVKRRLDHA